ncbi:hypothetical protein AVEN_74355-1 [Araneus ventricosus]|uniref:Uncharacterized protein n=1 Tax=Araneus ventricosus TaxID=182803 RepID=A0A4Y2DCG6_ARAVE|nr:hypothetical protein AVEN_74355-1 [Araneus ventricosus]
MRADCNAILKSPSVAYWQGLGRKAPDQKPYYNEDHTEEAKRPTVGLALKFGEGVPSQVSYSSSHQGSKLRG